MHNGNTWELPFGSPAVLELHSEWGALTLAPVEPGRQPRVELSRATAPDVEVHVDKVGNVVRVALDPHRGFNWFGGWECRAVVFVPRDVRASVQTSAGSISVRDLAGCELGIKASAGKIDLVNVFGLMHLSADAGSVTGRMLGGFFDVETHAGSVRAEIVDLQPGEHRIRATMGSVRLELARGLDVCVETRTSLGSGRNEYATRASAPARLLVSTEMGSIRIEETSMVSAAATASRTAASRRPEPAEPAASSRHEDAELERILKMVEAGSLSAREADELLKAMGRV